MFFFRVAEAMAVACQRQARKAFAGCRGSGIAVTAFESFKHAAVPKLARTGSRLGREFDTVAHVGVARSSIEPVAFRLRSLLFIEQQKRTVSIDWVGGRSEEALGTTVNPNYEASVF